MASQEGRPGRAGTRPAMLPEGRGMQTTRLNAEAVPDGARPLRRRRPLPGGRAVVGGFLVAAAVVGAFATSSLSSAHRVGYVVAARLLVPGERLVPADLALVPMQLSPALSDRLAFRSVAELSGAVVVAPLRPGELVQASDVVAGPPGGADRELSFPIPVARALNGELSPGDRVDVLATYGTGSGATTVLVASAVRVVALAAAPGALSSGDTDVVTLAVGSAAEALAIAEAADAGTVLLVRSTGAPPPTRTPPPATMPGAGPSSPAP
jgi:Flp pilus assembly protein CpaB